MTTPEDHYGRSPSATVQVDGDEKEHPCDWEIRGPAYGFSEWRIEAHGRIEAGVEVRVTLKCPLGVLTGLAIGDRMEVDSWGAAVTTLRGHGWLRWKLTEDAVEAAACAITLYDYENGVSDHPGVDDYHRNQARRVLEAATAATDG